MDLNRPAEKDFTFAAFRVCRGWTATMNIIPAVELAAKEHTERSAAKPQPKPLPLLHPMEKRAGPSSVALRRVEERRRVCFGLPLSSVLSPLLRPPSAVVHQLVSDLEELLRRTGRGERKKQPRARIFAACDDSERWHCRFNGLRQGKDFTFGTETSRLAVACRRWFPISRGRVRECPRLRADCNRAG